jgi:hypothetical protein
MGGQGRGLCIRRELEGDRGNASLAVGPGPHGRRGQLGLLALRIVECEGKKHSTVTERGWRKIL